MSRLKDMFSVFSDKQKTSEQIETLRKCAGSSFTRILFAGSDDEPLYMLKPGIINILVWVNERILFEVPKIKEYESIPYWIGVRIRIATNMLNQQVDSGNIPKEIAIAYHERMTSRIRQILGQIYAEDLPF